MRQTERTTKAEQTSTQPSSPNPARTVNDGILLAAVELFASRTGHTSEEKKVFLELARNLLPSSTLHDRRRVADLLVSHGETPHELLDLLARDPDTLTAYPALRYSPGLSVDLLNDVARTGPDALRMAITSRDSVPESVSRLLCDHAGIATIRLLLERPDLSLSNAEKNRLGRRSDIVAALEPELARNGALAPENLMGQYLHLSIPMRTKAIAAAAMASLVRTVQAGPNSGRAGQDTARLRLHGALLKAAMLQKRERFSETLGQGLGLPLSVSRKLIEDGQADALMIALKALGMDRAKVTTIAIRLLGETTGLETLRKALFVFRNVSTGAAETLVGHWTLAADVSDTTNAVRPDRHIPQHSDAAARPQDSTARNTARKVVAAPSQRRGKAGLTG